MRTALILLFLLAIAAVPGSVLPQRSLGVEKVDAYRANNPAVAPWLDRLALFDVFAAPWFAAVYLLLMTSLVGCLIPRLRDHVRALTRRPPLAPRDFCRLPAHASAGDSDRSPAETADRLAGLLRRRRFRVDVRQEWDGSISVAAEKGHLREAGNLLFHFALLALLAGVALGHGWGWYGNRLLVAGPENAFCTSTQQFDEYGLGPRLGPGDVPGYCLELRRFTAEFLDSGQPVTFRADIAWAIGGAAPRPYSLKVNEPLRLPGATTYLLGHGYAPQLRFTDSRGRALTSTVPFLPADSMLSSDGVAMFPDAGADPATGERSRSEQMAFAGSFLPTAGGAGRSAHPSERDPVVALAAYRGDLGLDGGAPQSVYTLPRRALDDGRLKRLDGPPRTLRPGETWKLEDGSTLEFLGTRRWITVTVRDDPGEIVVLTAAVMLLTGLVFALTVRRRRFWLRVTPVGERSAIDAAGLPRDDYPGFGPEFRTLVEAARKEAG